MNDNTPAGSTPMLTQVKPRRRRPQVKAPTPLREPWLDSGDVAWLAVLVVPALISVVALAWAP